MAGTITVGELLSDPTSNNKITIGSGTTLDLVNGAGSVILPASSLTGSLPSGMGGKVLQVVPLNSTAAVQSTTGTTYADLLTVAITPTSATSKILVLVQIGSLYMNLSGANQTMWRLARTVSGASATTTLTGQNTNFHSEIGRNETAAGTRMSIGMQGLDEPATTASTVYSVQVRKLNGTGNVQINDTAGTSSIVLMEIGA